MQMVTYNKQLITLDATLVTQLTRRNMVRGGVLAALAAALGIDPVWAASDPDPGQLAGLVRFEDEQVAPAGELIGSELDGRLFTDLARISATRLLTPTGEFYVRSAASRLLPPAAGWKVAIDGQVDRPAEVGIDHLRKAARPMGMHLMECAGNVALTRFGLMSVGTWAGVPVPDVLGEAKPSPGAALVEITGFDEYAAPSRTSIPGASWIFPLDDLKGAFLATDLNGQPLGRHHGAPVRLIVPQWYGAACIKWVNRITFLNEEAEASSQMKEYAVRTLQEGRPTLAREFQPARVEHAALPVRVEKWIAAGKIRYRVVGIAWGGSEPLDGLKIRFHPEEPFAPVAGFHPAKTDAWTVWTHPWSPASPGNYTIRLSVSGSVRARKLDMGLYDRSVHISEI